MDFALRLTNVGSARWLVLGIGRLLIANNVCYIFFFGVSKSTFSGAYGVMVRPKRLQIYTPGAALTYITYVKEYPLGVGNIYQYSRDILYECSTSSSVRLLRQMSRSLIDKLP